MQAHLKALLAITDLAGVQLICCSNGREDFNGLIYDHVIAPARLRGKVVTARIASGSASSTWDLDAVFRLVTPSTAGYGLLRQDLG